MGGQATMDSSYRRSRSHSRFPPIDEHPGGYPTGQPLDNSHRSKSLDNRRDFVPDDNYDPYRSIDRNSAFHASLGRRPRREEFSNQRGGGGGGGDFFNETITIPTTHAKPGGVQHFDSRLKNEADDDWTSYDRQVRYHTERTAYPVNTHRMAAPPPLYYEDYSYRNQIQPPPQELSPHSAISRYPESDLYQRKYDRSHHQNHQNQQYQQHQFNASNRPFIPEEGYDGYAENETHRNMDYMAANKQGGQSGMAAVSGVTSGAAGARGGGHQSYRYQHESQTHGGGGASGKARYGHSNGYSQNQNAFSQYREKRSGGGFFDGGRGKGSEPGERVYHRIHCCCFSFKWPPFAYEECEPPRPMYPQPPKDASPMPIRHQPPPPPPQY